MQFRQHVPFICSHRLPFLLLKACVDHQRIMQLLRISGVLPSSAMDMHAKGVVIGSAWSLVLVIGVTAFLAGLSLACAVAAWCTRCRSPARRVAHPPRGTGIGDSCVCNCSGAGSSGTPSSTAKQLPGAAVQPAHSWRRRSTQITESDVFVTSSGECWHSRADCDSIRLRSQKRLRPCRMCVSLD